MKYRNYSDATITLYTKCVHDLAYHYRISPLSISQEEIKNYFYTLIDKNTSSAKLHITYSAIKFFYKTHGQPHYLDLLPRPKRPFIIPEVLNQQEVELLLACSKTLRYKTIFTLIYSSGLRISEALNLEVSNIDFQRKMILIKNAKGNFDRYAILSDKMSELLRQYISRYKPFNHLFFTIRDKNRRIPKRYIQHIFHEQASSTGIAKRIKVHTLRHSFATHLLENNTNLFYIMKLLGHRSIKSTMIYLHMQRLDSLDLKSPLDIYDISISKTPSCCQKQFELAIA